MKQTIFCGVLFVGLIMASFAEDISPAPITLDQCGNIIGHEMGLWEFLAIPPNPSQVDSVLETPLRFVKVSLHKLKDNTWVVNHGADAWVYVPPFDVKVMKLADLTWKDVEKMKSKTASIVPIYRLRDYTERDQGQLCWLLNTKVPLDDSLVREIKDLGTENRTVIQTSSLTEVIYLQSLPAEMGIHFTGEARTPANLDKLFSASDRYWAICVEQSERTKPVIDVVHQHHFRALVNAMKYNATYEFFSSACKKVFDLGADLTQTNRPLQCMRVMGILPKTWKMKLLDRMEIKR